MDLTLATPVRYVPHIGPVMAGRLERLEIFTVQDLLYHVPFRYDDFSNVMPIAAVRAGDVVTVRGTIQTIRTFMTKTGKRIQEASVDDGTGTLSVIWFNQVYLLKILHPGDSLSLSGKIDWFGTKTVMSNPQYEIGSSLHTGRLVPVYPETEGVSSKWLRGRISHLLTSVPLSDFLPEEVRIRHHLVDLSQAIHSVHYPDTKEAISEGRRRIAFDEVFLLQLTSHEQRRIWRETQRAKKLQADTTPFTSSLPFTLTNDQKQALKDIEGDLKKPVPMNRLLVGDVGSGKTVVAAAAMYVAHKNNKRSVLMAPTQILAHQHFQTLQTILSPFGISVGQVTAEIKEDADVLVGTHALLTKKIKNVGLVVIDEQHRFGVDQRAKLIGKGKLIPHFLTMTATPIPRTIAKTLLGNIDVSVLNEMPKGRKIVKTWVVPPNKHTNAYEWVKKQQGKVFIICPLIESSETLVDVKAVKEEYGKMKKIFTKVGLLHGRMKAKEKTKVLDDFRSGTYRVLVATPVVEVGIDIKDATIMVVEGADRFGLGQLHQLRGRVGRGEAQSYCLLITDNTEEATITRLRALETIYNGPKLAEVDLSIRGPGEVFGTRQHGMPHLKIASFTDMDTIHEAQRVLGELPASLLSELAKKHIIQTVSKD